MKKIILNLFNTSCNVDYNNVPINSVEDRKKTSRFFVNTFVLSVAFFLFGISSILGQTTFYSQDFETTNDWNYSPPGTNKMNYWVWGSGTAGQITGAATYSGTASLQVWGWNNGWSSNYRTGNAANISASKTFDFSTIPLGSTITMTYRLLVGGEVGSGGTYYDYLNVILNGSITQGPLVNSGGWVLKTVDLSSFAGNNSVPIAFQWINNGTSGTQPGARIDDILITYSSCSAPSALTSSAITSSTATISWTAPATAPSNGYEYYVSTSATAPTAGTTATGSTAAGVTTANLTGLTANTTYYFWVRSNCGGGDTSSWVSGGSFYTGYCVPSTTYTSDYTSAFSTTGGITNLNYTATSQPSGSYSNQTAQILQAYIGLTINLSHTYVGGSNGVKIWIDWNNDLTFSATEEVFYIANSNATKTGSFNIPAGTAIGNYRMRVRSQFGSTANPTPCGLLNYGSTVDYTFTVIAAPSCLAPSALTSSAITSSTATISWTAASPAPASGYEYYVSTSTTAPTAGTTATGSTAAGVTTANLTGLTANTTYYFWVRSNCGGGDTSSWVSGGSFTTLFTPPSNDDCASAELISIQCSDAATTINGTTLGATEEAGLADPTCDPGTINDVWYTFNSGLNSTIYLNVTLGTASFLGGEIHTTCGNPASGLSPSNCDFNLSYPSPTAISGLIPNTTYRLRLFTNTDFDIPGTFTFTLTNGTISPSNPEAGEDVTICTGSSTQLNGSVTDIGAIYNLTTSGGSWFTEKWVNITTGINGTGTVVWAQGNGTIGNGAGLLTNQNIDLSSYRGQTLYLNAYDKLDDGWDDTIYNLSLNGNTVINNGGNSPDDGLNTDASSNWDGTSAEIERSEAFTVTPSITYSWSPTEGLSNPNIANPIASPTSTQTYTMTASYNGCSVTDQVTVTVNPNPTTANAGPDQQVCSTNTITLAANTVTTGTGAWSIVSGTGGTVTTPSSPTSTFTGTAGTSYTLRWTISNGVCTASTDDVVITILSPLDYVNLQFPGTATICEGNSLTAYGQVYEPGVTTLGVQGSGITVEFGYNTINNDPSNWTNWFGASFNTSSVNNNNDEYQYTFTPSAAGTYYYTFRYKQGTCDTWQYGGYASPNVNGVLTVNSNTAHTISLSSGSATSAVCQNTALGTNIVYAIGGGATGASVTGLPSGMSGSFNSGTYTISGTPTASGTFNYTVTTSGNGCASAVTATGTITVSGALDYVNLQFPGSGTICASGTFTAYGQVYELGVTTLEVQGSGITVEFGYNTTNNDPSNWTNWFGASFNTSSVNNNNDEYQYTFTPPSTGTFYYTFRYKQGSCDWQYGGYTSSGGGAWGGSNVSGVLTVSPDATASISANNGSICNNKTATFTLSGTSDAVVTYTINSGSNQTITLTGGTATISIPNATVNQTLNLVSVSSGSCSVSLSDSSTVNVAEVVTWNGSAWSSTPDASKSIVLNTNFTSTENIEACDCTVTSGNVVINSDHTVKLLNEITVNGGSITFENNSSLIQINNVTNSGNIIYKRTSPQQVLGTDYVYWSAPVSGQTVSNGYNYFWSNASGTSGNWVAAGGQQMDAGKGVIMRGIGSRTFTGVPFNGEIIVNVYRRNLAGYNDNWNLIGNPYPSAISADEFLAENDNISIDGSIAIWTHNSPISSANGNPFYGNFTYNYNPNDYIIYNLTGSQNGRESYHGYIPAGQAFFVKYDDDDNASPANASSTIKFKNSMRIDADGNSYSNSQFYRTSENVTQNLEKSRIWIDIISGNNASKRTVVGYVDSATDAKDRLFDATTSVTATSTTIYSLIGNDKMCIQAKGLPFNDSDIIPLGYNASQAGNYTIAIYDLDGLFVNQNVYLYDAQLNITHDIKATPYTFTATQGENNSRFQLIFNNETLSNPDFDSENAVFLINKDNLKVVSAIEDIEEIKVFDLLGRTIYINNNVDNKEFEIPVSQEKAALIVKIKLANGIYVERKTLY